MQQSDYEIVGKFGFESRTHRERVPNLFGTLFYFLIRKFFISFWNLS